MNTVADNSEFILEAGGDSYEENIFFMKYDGGGDDVVNLALSYDEAAVLFDTLGDWLNVNE